MVETCLAARELGKYRLIKEIGRGGMGVVYLSEDVRLGRRVALKVLYAFLHGGTDFHAVLAREARVLASLEHPNIVRVHSLEELEGHFAIDMEFVDGPSVNSLVRGGGIEVGQAVRIVHDALQGLALCHERGLIHRDVKPSNILLKSSGSALLSDFGLATSYLESLERVVETTATANILFGTPRYVPPEAWDGQEAACSWDVYAMGQVLYELLAGRPMIEGESALAVAKELLQPKHKNLIELGVPVSAELAAVVERMTALDPAQRLEDAVACVHELRAAPEFKEMRDQPTLSTPLRIRRIKRRKPPDKRMLPVFLALLVAMGFGGLWYVQANRPGGTPPQTIQPLEATVISMDSLLQDSTPTSDQLLRSSRNPNGQGRVLEASVIDAQQVRRLECLIEPGAQGQYRVFAFNERSIWMMHGSEEGGGVIRLSGGWAEYDTEEGGAVAHGVLAGTGDHDEASAQMTAALVLHNLTENSQSSVSFHTQPSTRAQTDTQFFYRLEEAQAAVPLLYREVLPRNLAWAVEMEAALPLLPGGRLGLTRITETSGGRHEMDGRLLEDFWKSAKPTPETATPLHWPHSMSGTIQAVILADTLLIGGQFPRASVAMPVMSLMFGPYLDPPLRETAAYRLTWGVEGNLLGEFSRGEERVPWVADWQAQLAEEGESWSFEIAMPLPQFGILSAMDGTISPMRLNLQVSDAAQKGGQPLIGWGFPILEEVEHGLLLVP